MSVSGNPSATDTPPARMAGAGAPYRTSMLRDVPQESVAFNGGVAATRPLAGLNTVATDDFAVALIEAWAEVCANVGFYQDHISAEAYLATADEARSFRELIRLIGYRPRPAIAASTVVSFGLRAVDAASESTRIRKGLPVQSVPAGSEPPQTFETSEDLLARPEWTEIRPSGQAPPAPYVVTESTMSVAIDAVVPSPKRGDGVLFAARAMPGEEPFARGVIFRTIDTVERARRGAILRLNLRPAAGASTAVSISDPAVFLFSVQARPFGADADLWPDAVTREKLKVGTLRGGVIEAAHGSRWARCNAGLPLLDAQTPDVRAPIDVQCLAFDEEGNAYAGTSAAGVFRLEPGAESWTPFGTGLEKESVTAIAVGSGLRLYAGTADERVYAWSFESGRWEALGDRVQKSRHGRTRGARREPLPRDPIRSLLVGHSYGVDLLLAGTDRGVFRWKDERRGWRGRSPGLPDWDLDTARARISALAFDRHSLDLYAATSDGVYRSRTLGYYWRHRGKGISEDRDRPSRVNDLILDQWDRPRNPTLFAASDAGVFVSRNGGRHWSSTGAFPPDLLPVLSLTVAGDRQLVAGTHRGVAVWDEASETWTPLPMGKPTDPNLRPDPMIDVTSIVGRLDHTLMAASPRGDFLELDWPHFWIDFPYVDIPRPKGDLPLGPVVVLRNRSTDDVHAAPMIGSTEALRTDFGLGPDRPITRIQLELGDAGDLRRRFPIRQTDVFADGRQAVLIPEASDRIVPIRGHRVVLDAIAEVPPAGRLVALTGKPARARIEQLGGIYRIEGRNVHHDGLVWLDIDALTVGGDGAVLAAVRDGGLWTRQAGATAWSASPAPLPRSSVTALTTTADGTLNALTGDGLWTRKSDEQSWTHSVVPLPSPIITALAGTADGSLHAVSSDGWWTRDRQSGEWARAAAQLPDTGVVALAGASDGSLRAATTDGRLWSYGATRTWEPLTGLPFTAVRSIAVTPDGGLLVGTASLLRLHSEQGAPTGTIEPTTLFTCDTSATAGIERGIVGPDLLRAFDAHAPELGDLEVVAGSGPAAVLQDNRGERYLVVRGTTGRAQVALLPASLRIDGDPTTDESGETTWLLRTPASAAARVTVSPRILSFVEAAADDATRTEVARIRSVESPDSLGRAALKLDHPLDFAYDPSTVAVNANTIEATAGATVYDEVLGNGDDTVAGQAFTLAHSPLTYLATDDGLTSTLSVAVAEHQAASPGVHGLFTGPQSDAERVRWDEVPRLADAGPTARVYEVRQDDDGTTTVRFGDGVHGARLPAGYGNVTATYRHGIDSPGPILAGQLTLLPGRPRGVRTVTNPLPASGDAPPEGFDEARIDAPLSTQAPDRVVSLRDYERFAQAFPGVGHACAQRLPGPRREVVHLTIAAATGEDLTVDSPLITSLGKALRSHSARPVALTIQPAAWVWLTIDARLIVNPDFDPDQVAALAAELVCDAYGPRSARFEGHVTSAGLIGLLQAQPGVSGVELNTFSPTADPNVSEPILRAARAVWDTETSRFRPATLIAVRHPDNVRIDSETAK
jgi:hypothetical protein